MKISLLFPEKNQGEKLVRHLQEDVIPYFDAQPVDYEILLCPNGCSEEEMALLSSCPLPAQVRALPNAAPGKGSGVKAGIKEARGDYVLFMDADLATGLDVFEKEVLPRLGKADAIIASRDLKASVYGRKQPWFRRFTHFASRLVIATMFRLKVKDTQCGYKAFKTSVAKALVEKQLIDGFAFDVEYLYFLRRNGFSIAEVPCVWTDDPDSTIKRKGSVYRAFYRDLRRIKKAKAHYELTPEELSGAKGVTDAH